MIDLRNEILRKPLGLMLTSQELEEDKDCTLIGAFEDDIMLGCCMLQKEKSDIVLRQMAVRNQLQGKGIGRALMNFAEVIAHDIGYREMRMYARKAVQGFYEKLGYKSIGEDFEKLGILHVIMKKPI